MSANEWVGKTCKAGKPFALMRTATQYINFAAATTGAQASKEVFTVTGTVVALAYGRCDSDLNGATATLTLGTENGATAFIASTTATTIDTDELWQSNTPAAVMAYSTIDATWQLINGADIGYTVGTADITSGTMTFYCHWFPISDNGDVIAAGSNVTL